MRTTFITAVALCVIIFAGLAGCSSKKEKAPLPQQAALSSASKTKPIAGVAQTPATAASPQDEADAAILKQKVLMQVKAADFSAIYKEASAGFREVGPENQFTGLWQLQLKETGPFKDAKEVSHSVRPQDKFLIYIYHVQYEKVKKELRLTFGRSKKGKMELTGINHKEIK